MGEAANDSPGGSGDLLGQPGYQAIAPGVSPRSGKPPPVEHQFPPGTSGNLTGRPKGSHSARAALQRKWRKGWDQDPERESEDDGIGSEARRVADAIHQAALRGDTDAVRSLATLIDQVEGRPQERVEHSGQQARTIVVHAPTTSADAPLPSEGA